jgi:hypothetical protein
MALIALTTADTLEVFDSIVETQKSAPCSVDVSAGQLIRLNTSAEWVLANGGAAGTATGVYVAGFTKSAGQALTGFKKCKVDGLDLSGLAFGALAYLSDTAGRFGDAAGTVSLAAGRVIPGYSEVLGNAPKKILQVDLPL